MGATIGAFRVLRWWKRGLLIGLLLSPVTVAALTIGGTRLVFGLAAMTATVVCGVIISRITDAIFPISTPVQPDQSPALKPVSFSPRPVTSVKDRLADGKACLDYIAGERTHSGDPHFGQETEDRIVWGELLELELQAIDEHRNQTGQRLNPNS